MSGERSEKASEQRKRKSREKGDFVSSRELTSAAAMLAGLLLMPGASTRFFAAWQQTYAAALASGIRGYENADGLARVLPALVAPGFLPLTVVMGAAVLAAVGAGVLQAGGVQVRVGALGSGFARLNPAANIKNLFSARSVVRFAKSLLPAAAVVLLASASLRHSLSAFPVYSQARLPVTLQATYALTLNAAWISLAWAAFDYSNEWRMWNSKLKMTKEEVKQEIKESNGNPHTKGRIRQIQRSMRRRRVKADVSKAAVVITNPTHYAVALMFDFAAMTAPKVLAKGRDLHAFEIRDAARWAGVPIVENPPLARSLYRSVDEGQSIPFELYAAVAAILAYIVREGQRREQRAYGAQPTGYSAMPRTLLGTVEHRTEGSS